MLRERMPAASTRCRLAGPRRLLALRTADALPSRDSNRRDLAPLDACRPLRRTATSVCTRRSGLTVWPLSGKNRPRAKPGARLGSSSRICVRVERARDDAVLFAQERGRALRSAKRARSPDVDLAGRFDQAVRAWAPRSSSYRCRLGACSARSAADDGVHAVDASRANPAHEPRRGRGQPTPAHDERPSRIGEPAGHALQHAGQRCGHAEVRADRAAVAVRAPHPGLARVDERDREPAPLQDERGRGADDAGADDGDAMRSCHAESADRAARARAPRRRRAARCDCARRRSATSAR